MNRISYSKLAIPAALLLAALPAAAKAPGIESLKFLGKISVQQLIARFVQGLFGLTGAISLAFFVYGGVLWMTSQGDSKQIEKARNTIVWASLGIFVVLGAYGGVKFVLGFLE
jgi:ABC-type uncharacterized transport system permease subunit